MRALALFAALLVTGCTLAVDVDDYTFEEEPCGPRPPACRGGREIAFALRSLGVPAADGERRRDGFDLDGTDAAICGRADLVGLDGRAGVDNELAEVVDLYEDLTGVDVRADNARHTISGGPIELVVLGGVDDLESDDCVEVSRRRGLLPAGRALADLDADGDGLLDEGVALDYLTPTEQDPAACVIDGVLYARFSTVVSIIPGTTYEANVDRGRLRVPVGGNGPTDAIFAGSVRIEDLNDAFPSAVVEFIARRADLDPSSRTANDCSSISFGFTGTLVPATLGALRPL